MIYPELMASGAIIGCALMVWFAVSELATEFIGNGLPCDLHDILIQTTESELPNRPFQIDSRRQPFPFAGVAHDAKSTSQPVTLPQSQLGSRSGETTF
jgi:hypothetical protein